MHQLLSCRFPVSRLFTILLGLLLLVSTLEGMAQDYRKKRKRLRNRSREQEQPSPAPEQKARKPKPQVLILTARVVDSRSEEPLFGANVQVKGTVLGAITDMEGRFRLELTEPDTLPVIRISYIGYTPREITVPESGLPDQIGLEEALMMTEQVVVSASRRDENLTQSPVAVQKLTLQDFRTAPANTAFDQIATLSGLDFITSSQGIKTINARGFNSTSNQRFVHRIDGMEMLAPGLGIQMGTLAAFSDIDFSNLEVVVGPASALYGPNAMNGIVSIESKNPFDYPGLSVDLRAGFNHVDSPDADVHPLGSVSFRYAHVFNNKFAVKLTAGFSRAEDWYATDSTDLGYYGTFLFDPGYGTNPGYNGMNVYGDEVSLFVLGGADIGPQSRDTLAFHAARQGYTESQLTDYDNRLLNVAGAAHYRFNDQTELIYEGRIFHGDAILQTVNRYQLENMVFQQHKLELRGPKFFIRAYTNLENAGDSYNLQQTATEINRAWKPDTAWLVQFSNAVDVDEDFNAILQFMGRDTLTYGELQGARDFANADNSDFIPVLRELILEEFPEEADELIPELTQIFVGGSRLVPGTPAFARTFDEVIRTNFNQGGSRIVDRSQLYHLEGQYRFDRLWPGAELLTGGSFRYFHLDSEQTLFYEKDGNIQNWEFGAYGQLIQNLARKRIRLIGSLRYDKNDNFKGQFSPRLSAMFFLGPKQQHAFRLTAQTAFRIPSMQEQYLNNDIGFYLKEIGGLLEVAQAYGLDREAYDAVSVLNYRIASFFNEPDAESLLERVELEELRPEQVQSAEVGYRGQLLPNLYLDLVYYYNRFSDFIFYRPLAGQITTPDREIPEEPLTLEQLQNNEYQLYGRPTNYESFDAHGVSAGFDWQVVRNVRLSGNYSYNALVDQDFSFFELRVPFNTPEHKVNLGVNFRNLLPKDLLSIRVNYRWNDAFHYDSGLFFGDVPAYNLVDLQFTLRLPRYKTLLKLGGTNILNNRHIEAAGAPTIGALYYVQLSFDSFLN